MAQQNSKTVLTLWEFNSPECITAYWQLLVSLELDYHLDDSPADIFSSNTLLLISQNHDRLWSYCKDNDLTPWDFITID